jgi:phage shock protein C
MVIPGSQILIYPVLWILMPSERVEPSPVQLTQTPPPTPTL